MPSQTMLSVAVIGAGIAGATVACALARAGHAVHVFDKSRGPGGRLATRRVDWVDHQGHAHTTPLDHGAVGFTASGTAFRAFADLAVEAGRLAKWRPTRPDDSLPLEAQALLYVPVPDMPALCRHLLAGLPATWSFAVDGLHKGPDGWRVQAAGARHALRFDAVVVALPPAQAAPLLIPHRLDWSRFASVVPMQPCWTLMGIAKDPDTLPAWGLARPAAGPLAWVQRNDARPHRARVTGQAHWVAHARAAWSRRHLEQPASWVQPQMQAALADLLGRPIDWQHCTVHRWRYAVPPAHATSPAAPFWWDAAQGLGVCGDFLGGCGVEGAWLSAQALGAALLQRPPDAVDASGPGSAAQASAAVLRRLAA